MFGWVGVWVLVFSCKLAVFFKYKIVFLQDYQETSIKLDNFALIIKHLWLCEVSAFIFLYF